MKNLTVPARSLVSLATLLLISASASAAAGDPADGVVPATAGGQPLNLDFEAGTLAGWSAEGDAFAKQPIKGDTVAPRRKGMRSAHQGEYWVGGYEQGTGDDATGTLTSAPFKVTHRYGTFLMAGGAWPETRVELLTDDDDKVFFKAHGQESEGLRPVLVDMKGQLGRAVRIRLVDGKTGPWGHVNFDHFRLHSTKPALQDELLPPPPASLDQMKHAGLSPADAAKAMTLPPGFRAQVFAAEPDVVNPIAFTIDARGRLWVAQSFTYPKRAAEGQGQDSILIFEDTDGDGTADKRTVFAEKLNLVSGIEVGFGGVYVGAAPYLMHIPFKDDENGVTKPAGEPKILLDGWGFQDTHETLNTFCWGPDGWLYGCHGVFTKSLVGKPGTPKEQRQYIDGGIWRYHPTRHVFERFAEGTSNPWGLDYDERGQFIIEACVIPHLWHIIQNARYQRQAGQHNNPYTFDDIKQIGDHVHYLGDKPHAGNNRSDTAGGGHAHSGLMVYNGDNWPAEYRGKVFMNNIHGARINMDVPEPKGSGYVGRHGKDFLLANDKGSQILNMRVGPDGSVYMIDWYDLQQCHTQNPKDHDRTTGRIFKVSYGDVKPAKADLEKLSDAELGKLQTHKNVWHERTARRVLQERAADPGWAKKPDQGLFTHLVDGATDATSTSALRLRYMWTLNAIGSKVGWPTLEDKDPHVAAWAVRLAREELDGDPLTASGNLTSIARLAKSSPSPVVRLHIASAVHRLPVEQRWYILAGLLSHAEDADDHNLPLMYWYGLESVMDQDPTWALTVAAQTKIPNILAFAARRQATIGGEKELDGLVALLGRTPADEQRAEILRGMTAGLKGRRGLPAPKGWDKVEADLARAKTAAVVEQARGLSVVFGSKAAMAAMTKTALDRSAAAADRLAAIDSLREAKDPSLAGTLQELLDDPAVRSAAIRGLAGYDDASTPAALLGKYGSFTAAEKKDALLTLAARPAYAKVLAGEVDKAVPKADFTAEVLRPLRNLDNPDVNALLDKYWAAVRETEKDKLVRINKWKRDLSQPTGSESLSRGHLLYNKACASCHTMFGEGGKVGPDITGADRGNLDYLLLHVVDPNAVIPADYRAWQLDTTDDRTIIGILKKNDPQAVTLSTANETVVVARDDIATFKPSNYSMMPEGLLDTLPENDVRDLIAYLRSAAQVPVLADADAAKQLFNGKDLTGWEAIVDDVFSVENGELVGRTKTGLKKNQFLASNLAVRDFRLVVKMKLTPDKENSGIQFRSVRLPNSHEMKGTQADAGQGWWGKLYEESGRKLLFPKKGEKFDGSPFVEKDDWNTYEILAVGGRIRTAINGRVCTDLDDDQVAKEGIFGLQVHSGGPLEVRWKDFELEIDPTFELKTVAK